MISQYFESSSAMLDVAGARQVGAARALLKAAERRRDEIRIQVEQYPKQSDDVRKDMRYQLGMIAMANWLMELPELATRHINNLPKGD